MKLACVVHRYGADIAGGSEAHCRHVAEHLAADHDVTVLTTAPGSRPLANEYRAGSHRVWARAGASASRSRGSARCTASRDQRDRFSGTASRRRAAQQWFRENGPDAPELLAHLRAARRELRPRAVLGVPLAEVVSSACRWSPTAPCWCRPPRKIRSFGWTCSTASSRCPPASCSSRPKSRARRAPRAGVAAAVVRDRIGARPGGRRRGRRSRARSASPAVRAVPGAHRSEQGLRDAAAAIHPLSSREHDDAVSW